MKYKYNRHQIVARLRKLGYHDGDLRFILDQCNLLLETKKAKKRKCNCETNYEFEPCPVHTPDPKEEMREFGGLYIFNILSKSK